MSRPTKLDAAKCREIIALAYCGPSRRAIAEYIECAPGTIENTARRNPAFAEAHRAATSRYIRENCRTVMQQFRTSWRAAAWSLERMQTHKRNCAPAPPASTAGCPTIASRKTC